ncbi:MAG: LysM peptidoglycan-binding domain-containing protein [Armatimonadota bacterium]
MIHPAYSSMNGRSIIRLFVLFGIVAIVSVVVYTFISSRPHEIIIDGVVIAKTASLSEAKESVKQAKTNIAGKQLPENIRLPQQIGFRRASDSTDIVSVYTAAETVSKIISAEALLYTINADGKPVAAFNNKDDAESVIKKLRTNYDDLPGDIKGQSSFKEKIQIKRQFAPLQVACASVDDGIELLTSYTQLPRKHTVVEGERAVKIADKYHIPVSDIMRYNPDVDITMLEPHQQLVIHPGIKSITVVTKAFVTMTSELKAPSDVYRRSRKITGKRTTKMLTVYENGQPVQSDIVSQVTTWKRPKYSEYRRRRRSTHTATKPLAEISPLTKTTSPAPTVEPGTP